jgi:hypothetical protein
MSLITGSRRGDVHVLFGGGPISPQPSNHHGIQPIPAKSELAI